MNIFFHIGNFLAKLFGKNADFLIGMFSKRTALTLGSLALIIAMFATLYTAVTAIISGLAYATPAAIVIGASWVMPDNINELLTAYIAFRVALALYRWKGHQFNFMAKGF